MHLLDRLIRIQTGAEARRFTALYGLAATVLSAGASAGIAHITKESILLDAITGGLIAAVIAPAMTWPLAKAAVALSERERALEQQANTDPLTDALNRRGFFAAAAPMTAQADAGQLCAMLLDLDSFKQINDTYGHAAGDAVVIAAARAIAHVAEAHQGLVGRLGGDEFGILFPAAGEAGAAMLAERLRSAVETRIVQHDGRFIRVTASVGAAIRKADDAGLDDLLARADASLYAAKSQGRNRTASGALAPRKRA